MVIEDLVERALNDGAVVRVAYRDYQDRETQRLIRPLRRDPTGLVHSYCYLRNATRNFRISRIEDCTRVDHEAILAEDSEQRLARISSAVAQLDPTKNDGRIEFASLGHTPYRVYVDSRRVHQNPVCRICASGDEPDSLGHPALELLEKKGFSTGRLAQREMAHSSLDRLVEWVFRVALNCGSECRVEIMSVEPGRSDSAWDRTDVTRGIPWSAIRDALERLMQYPADRTLVGFQAVHDWEYNYVQFIRLAKDSGCCLAVKLEDEKNALGRGSQLMLLCEGFELELPLGAPLQAMCDVRFDEPEVLADLGNWIFTEVFGLGENYQIEIVNAPWQCSRGYGEA